MNRDDYTEGSPEEWRRITPIEDAIKQAMGFAVEVANTWKNLTGELLKPRVDHLEDGTIDIHWKTKDFELLLNADPEGGATYYGDNLTSESSIKGNLKKNENPAFLAFWMHNQLPQP